MRRALHKNLLLAILLIVVAGVPSLALIGARPRPSSVAPGSGINHWRSIPLRILPEPGFEGTISRDELRAVAFALIPRWKIGKVPEILHALRLWGLKSDFSGDSVINSNRRGILSGPQMLERVLDDRVLRKSIVPSESILYWTKTGIQIQYGTSSSPAHCDQLLKVAAEIGLPADSPVFPAGGRRGTLNDIIRDSLRDFLIDQELEFTAIAYSRWLPPYDRWTNRFGNTTTFEDLVDALLKAPLGTGACAGTHLPYALVSLLRANDAQRVLSPSTAMRIERRLLEIARALEGRQSDEGAWFADWAQHGPKVKSSKEKTFEAILVTGHHLEWIAMAPDRLRPDREAVVRAARLLARIIPRHDFGTISNPRSFGPFSHAARALMLLEGAEAADLIRPGDPAPIGRRPGESGGEPQSKEPANAPR
jgi:hypothetical protein